MIELPTQRGGWRIAWTESPMTPNCSPTGPSAFVACRSAATSSGHGRVGAGQNWGPWVNLIRCSVLGYSPYSSQEVAVDKRRQMLTPHMLLDGCGRNYTGVAGSQVQTCPWMTWSSPQHVKRVLHSWGWDSDCWPRESFRLAMHMEWCTLTAGTWWEAIAPAC